ncbi:MAG: hypothetical protein IPL52_08470 [Flavobacteriales bacterium]|nr:hypothetical protein [Flavobacteriales bacterium]
MLRSGLFNIASLRRALVLGVLMVATSIAWADHYSGASITYNCVGPNQYQVSLDLYLDCSGAGITPQSLYFNNDCGVSFTLNNVPMVLNEEVSQLCPSQLANSTCNGGTEPGIWHYQFQTTLVLSPCNDWTISWNICCRNTTNNVQLTPGMYVEATLNNLGGICDDSPQFGQQSIPYTCVNEPVSYNPLVTDPDGNALLFSLISARFASPLPTPVLYTGGYSGAAPIPGIAFNTNTGQMDFTPTLIGNYVVVVQVTSYNSLGQPIGTVMLDFLFVVTDCANPPADNLGPTSINNGIITGINSIEVCHGVPFCVDLTFTDIDPAAVITLGGQVSAQLPGSSLVFSGSNPAVATICWTPNIALSPISILLNVSDNACPIVNLSTYALTITVVNPPPVPPNPGTPAVVPSCVGATNINLFNQLGGTPDPGGSWTGPNGAAHSSTFNPATDLFGVYTYTVGTGCLHASATVTVTQSIAPNAGTSALLNTCGNSAATNMFALLGGSAQAGGSWSGPSPVVGNLYNPATMAPGAYVYTVLGSAPCPNATATITVTESVAPNAGTNGTLTLCSTSAATSLIAQLGGGPAAGGTWTGPSPVGGLGNYNPATMNPGVYTYTITGVAPCVNATATVTVTENTAVNAGANGALSVCSNGAAVSMIASLAGAQAGGTWSGPSPVVGGNYDPPTMAPGVYTYTLLGVAPCPNDNATLTVTENAAPNAGTNGTLTICSNGVATSLIAQLGGGPAAGGTWSGPSPVGGAGNYNPATMNPGVYTYTVNGVAPCANATATVTVTENAAPIAGTNGNLAVCANGAAVALISGLGGTPAVGGTWSGPSPVVGGNYDPVTMNAGVYTYTVTGVAPCANATATVTVVENAPPNAGTNGTLTICSNGVATSLIAQLGGGPAAGGTWSGPSPVGGAGNYNPATMNPGVYTYTVNGVAPCTNSTATVTVTENTAPTANSGTNGALTICSNGVATSLIAQLGGGPAAGGTWSGPSPVGGAGNYNPATMNPGVYTYTVNGVAPCTNSTATVTVTENTAPTAGSNGNLAVCANGAAVALGASLGGSPDPGGAWSGPSPVVGGNYDPVTMNAGVYTYTVTGVAPCANANATVTVVENAPPNAGTNGALTICSNGVATSLIAQLGGGPAAGGTWSGPSPVGGAGNYNPATMNPGVYTYTVNGVAPCTNSTATVTVTENAAPVAGANGNLTVCANGAAVALGASLGGAPDPGGAWSGPSPVVGGNYDPVTMNAGVYTYTVAGIAPCVNATATVTVVENAATDAGSNGTLTVCSNSGVASLLAQLGGVPQAGGAWSGPSPVVGGNYNPVTMAPGVYTYTVAGIAPCVNSTATVTVTENPVADAGTNGTLTVCSSSAPLALIAQLGGTPQAGGAWSGPSPVIGGIYDPATMNSGVYTYTVAGIAPCVNASATVTVTENSAVSAGVNGSLTLCSNGAAVALLAGLGGTPDAGGAWSGPSAVAAGNYDPATMTPGVYTYTVNGVAPCANASAAVTVTENAATDAGTNGSVTLCSGDAAASLFAQLGGVPQAGGVWSGPSPVVGGNYDPATMNPGVYTYGRRCRSLREHQRDSGGGGESRAERWNKWRVDDMLQWRRSSIGSKPWWFTGPGWRVERTFSGSRREL